MRIDFFSSLLDATVQWGHRSGATCQLESVGGDPRRLRPGSRIDIGEKPPEDLLAGQVGFSSQIS